MFLSTILEYIIYLPGFNYFVADTLFLHMPSILLKGKTLKSVESEFYVIKYSVPWAVRRYTTSVNNLVEGSSSVLPPA
jgi:hypothetical protein